MSRNTSALAELGDTVTDGLTDAWAATAAYAQELASSAAATASDLGAAASGGLSDGADRLGALYDQARHQIRPPRRRTSPWPFVAALIALAGVVWLVRRRRAADQDTTGTHLSPVSGQTDTARAAAGS